MELLTVAAQVVLVGLLACWLVIGVYENIRAPEVNLALVREVFSMSLMRDEAPAIYDLVESRKVTSDAIQRALFMLIVAFEAVVAGALSVGTLLLIMALFGAIEHSVAVVFAGWAVLGFIVIWGLFLVGGNWFHYWVAHKGSQYTHYFMTIWGLLTLGFLM